jgi:ATP-dependent metalloprotease
VRIIAGAVNGSISILRQIRTISSISYHRNNIICNQTYIPKRNFIFGLLRPPSQRRQQRLMALFDEAESEPGDARRQANLLRELFEVHKDPRAVIERFEQEGYARDAECASYYLMALMETGKMEKAAKLLIENREIISTADNSGGDPKRAAQNPIVLNFGTKDRPLYVENASRDPKTWRFLSSLGNLLLTVGLFYAIYRASAGRLEDMFGRSVHKQYKAPVNGEQRACTFDDVRGCDEAKGELQEIVEFLKDPNRFNKLGAHLPKGVLLVGPPGTGKTLLARAVAGEANVPFIYASGAEFDEMFVGLGSMRIRQMFEAAKEQSPAIIFIDEIDAIGSKRNPRDPQHARMSLNQLLVELDGFSDHTGIIVIGATNFPETLDKALLRPGRFDRHVHVPLPDVRGRSDILDLYLRDVKLDKDVDRTMIARGTTGFSGADLNKLVNQAKIAASLDNSPRLAMKHLEAAKDEMIMGKERRSAAISDDDKTLTAYHEGGHAIVALLTPAAVPIHKATIVPRGQALGMVAQLPDRDELSLTRQQLLARLDVAMGGRVAEELFFGPERVTTGASSDFTQATNIARAMVMQYGMGESIGTMVINSDDLELLSPETKAAIDQEVRRLLEDSRQRAMNLLSSNRAAVEVLAKALLERETLSGDEIRRIVSS